MVENDTLMCPSQNKLFIGTREDGCLGSWTEGLGGWVERFGYKNVLLVW